MSSRQVIVITTTAYVVLGLALALFGPMMLQLYGFPAKPTVEVPEGAWSSAASFARLFGIALAGLGMIVWSLRGSEPMAQHKLVASLAVANVLLAAFSFGQWRSVWGTPFGILTVCLFAGLGLISLIRVAETQRLTG